MQKKTDFFFLVCVSTIIKTYAYSVTVSHIYRHFMSKPAFPEKYLRTIVVRPLASAARSRASSFFCSSSFFSSLRSISGWHGGSSSPAAACSCATTKAAICYRVWRWRCPCRSLRYCSVKAVRRRGNPRAGPGVPCRTTSRHRRKRSGCRRRRAPRRAASEFRGQGRAARRRAQI